LGIEPGSPGDAVKIYDAPDGKQWKARILIAQAAPELLTRPRTPEEEVTVAVVAPPVVEEQQDSNATVTALALFAGCPRKYYLNRYLGFEGRATQRSEGAALDAGEFGTQVHTLLAGTTVMSPDPDAVRLAEVFRQSPLGKRAANATRIEREFDFLLAIADQVIVGQVDLWFEENGELVVVDYKTDAVSAAEASHRARDYGLQLRLYALAIERMTGRAPDRGFVHFLRPNVAVEVDLTPSLIESPEQVVRDFQDAQSKLVFPLVEGEHCKRCAYYRDLCPAGGATKEMAP